MLNHVFSLDGKQYFWDHVLYTILHCSSGISPFDTVGSNEEHDKEKLDKLLHHLMEVDLITDGTVARDHTQLKVGIVPAWYCFRASGIKFPLRSRYVSTDRYKGRVQTTAIVCITFA
mgnify:CR=1 FL=1